MTAKHMLITRPELQARRFAALCFDRFGAGIDVVVAPLMRIEPLRHFPQLAGIRGLIFTSTNAVAITSERMNGRDLPVWCVGHATARAAENAGFDARLAGGDATALVDRLIRDRPEGPLLHLRGRHARGRVAEALTGRGVETREAVVYDQVEQDLPEPGRLLLARPGAILLPVFSPRSARLLVPWLAGARPQLRIAAISPAVSAELAGQDRAVIETAARPDAASLLEALARLWSAKSP